MSLVGGFGRPGDVVDRVEDVVEDEVVEHEDTPPFWLIDAAIHHFWEDWEWELWEAENWEDEGFWEDFWDWEELWL